MDSPELARLELELITIAPGCRDVALKAYAMATAAQLQKAWEGIGLTETEISTAANVIWACIVRDRLRKGTP